MKKHLLLIIIIVFALTVAAFAQNSGANIQINNGSVIEVTDGQSPQIVVQFGNTSDKPLTNVHAVCTIEDGGQGSLTFVENQVYPNALQTYNLTENQISFPAEATGIELIAGQNYNVSFNVLVEDTEDVGVIRTVVCELFTDQGFVTSTSVTVQTPGAEPIFEETPEATESPETTPEATAEVTASSEMTPEVLPEATEPVLGTGDVQITLNWNNEYDLDLYVTELEGEIIYYDNRLSETGGELDVDANYPCGENLHSVENVFWEDGEAPAGDYLVSVVIGASTCDSLEETEWTLTVRVEDEVFFEMEGTGIPDGQGFGDRQHAVAFRVSEDGTTELIELPEK